MASSFNALLKEWVSSVDSGARTESDVVVPGDVADFDVFARGGAERLEERHVWWLRGRKDIQAYIRDACGTFHEVTPAQCAAIWPDPSVAGATNQRTVGGKVIPIVPPSYFRKGVKKRGRPLTPLGLYNTDCLPSVEDFCQSVIHAVPIVFTAGVTTTEVEADPWEILRAAQREEPDAANPLFGIESLTALRAHPQYSVIIGLFNFLHPLE